jgi:hypothetical protein
MYLPIYLAVAQGQKAFVESQSQVITSYYPGDFGSNVSLTGVVGLAAAWAIDLPEMPDISGY